MNPSHSPRNVYLLVIIVWLLLFGTLMTAIVVFDIERAREAFEKHTLSQYHLANDRVRINDVVLEGFAAMVGTSNGAGRERIHSYARDMLARYPHVFSFQVVEKVSREQLASFVEYYRRTEYPDFEVKTFDYDSGRQWRPVKKVPQHFPIVFMEPFPPESRKVLGLDQSYNDFFMRALQASEKLDRAVATIPFTLVEGKLAYLLYRPIRTSYGRGAAASSSGATGGYAVLVLTTDSLLGQVTVKSDTRVLLYNPEFSSADRAGYLYLSEPSGAGWLQRLLFPRLEFSKPLESNSQPFILDMKQQLGWSVVSWGKLGLTLVLAMLTFGVLLLYARFYSRVELERAENAQRLFYRANHDNLTGLANRDLLNDRISHAIAQTNRQNKRLGLLFLDLNGFKMVNDRYGHDVGDGVLKRAAERLRACVRAGDTIARLGGDEFVLVLEQIEGPADIDHVIAKIKSGFEQPFNVDDHVVSAGVSIGSAIYPGDGRDLESLLKRADATMYEDKHSAS